jgi:acyl dehydratase
MREVTAAPALGPLYRRAVLRRPSGRTLPDRRLVWRDVRVDRAHLAAYDRVCGFRLRDELPATYPHVLAFPLAMTLMTDADFPFAVLGLVHIGNRVVQRRPLSSGVPMTLTVWAEHLRVHERGTAFDIVATATDADGDELWLDRSTYLKRGRSSPAADTGSRTAGHDEAGSPRDTSSIAGRDDTGSPHDASPAAGRPTRGAPPTPSAIWRVGRRIGSDYAAASGDRNPIHTSRLLARAFGFPGTIAHGMWTKARCLAALEGRLPAAFEVDVRFKRPILLPATVAFTVTRRDERTGVFTVDDAGRRTPHLTGTLTSLTPPTSG